MLGRYSIGPATVSLGYSALSSSPVVHMARPLMQELADQTGAAVALGTRDGLEMVYLANCRSMCPVSLRLNVGSRLPLIARPWAWPIWPRWSPISARLSWIDFWKSDPKIKPSFDD